MLKERTVVDRIEITGEDRHVHVKTFVEVYDDVTNEIKGRSVGHRSVAVCGAYDQADAMGPEVRRIADAVWTPEMIREYKDSIRGQA